MTSQQIASKRKEIKSFKGTVAAAVVFMFVLVIAILMQSCNTPKWADDPQNWAEIESVAHDTNYEIWPTSREQCDSLKRVIESENASGNYRY